MNQSLRKPRKGYLDLSENPARALEDHAASGKT